MEEIVIDILSTILASTLIAALLIYSVYLVIYIIRTENIRQDHIKTLNEHDKSVILDYKNTFWSLKKHKKQNKDKELSSKK